MNAPTILDKGGAAYLSAELSRCTVLVPATGPVSRFYNTRELKVVREVYPVLGVMATAMRLPGRTVGSVYAQAQKLGLRSPRMKATRRERWRSTPHIDDAIRRAYQATPHRGMLRDLSAQIMRPETWTRDRAVRLGVVMPRFKELPWTEPEIAIITARATQDPANIRLALKREGFKRSATAIVVKLKRLKVSRASEDDGNLSATALAELMGVNATTVANWIARGWLQAAEKRAKPREDGRAVEWRIRPVEVRRFIIENVAAVDLRKVDKVWFVDLLAARVTARGELA